MHELGIAEQIVQIVAAEGAKAGAVRVVGASVSVGLMMAVERDNLLFCLDVIKAGDPLTEHTVFSLEEEPLRLRCRSCGQITAVAALLFVCAACRTSAVGVIGGDQLEVSYLEVEMDESRREAERDGGE